MPNTSEIERLKEEWSRDPTWDIEDTPGYEEHREELAAWSEAKHEEWERKRIEKFLADANRIGCAENPQLAEYVFDLERRLTEAVDTIERLREELSLRRAPSPKR